MGECIFENAGNFMRNYPLKKEFATTFGKGKCKDEEYFVTQSNKFLHAELDYFEEILREYNTSETNVIESMDCCSEAIETVPDAKANVDLRQVSCQLLQKLQEKKVNLVLVATSLEESDVVEKLEGSLDPKTYSMIPLNFDNNNVNDEDNAKSEPTLLEKKETHLDQKVKIEKTGEQSERQSCSRKQSPVHKDAKYWKRRSSNNEAARRSRDAKKVRFAWVQERTKELEVENANLRKQLESLEREVLEKEKEIVCK